MGGLRVALVLIALHIFAIPPSLGVPEPCMTVYNEGGVSALLQSLECSHWIQSAQSVQNQTSNCQFTTLQGRREEFNDQRISCNLDMQIPFPGKYSTEEVRVGVVAVFDGHIGEEASEMASKLLLDYFFLHSVFTSYKEKLTGNKEHLMVLEEQNEDVRQEQHDPMLLSSNRISDESKHMRIFKEALLRSIYDIDSIFSKEASERHIIAGSTATIAVLVDGHFLVANVGNSKAFLCSENTLSHKEAKGNNMTYVSAKELTEDHSPSRADERERLVASGGSVKWWGGRYWANDYYVLTRAIGHVFLKSNGVTSEPEVTDWQPLTANDTHLVVATHSIVHKLTPQKVCDLLHSAPRCISFARSSDCIAFTACEEGNKNNLSVIVVPLRSVGFSQEASKEKDVM